jgi:hypothetical protein
MYMGETAGLVTKHYREELLFKNRNIFRPPERRSYSGNEFVSKELNSLFEEHAGANVSVCTLEEWVDIDTEFSSTVKKGFGATGIGVILEK